MDLTDLVLAGYKVIERTEHGMLLQSNDSKWVDLPNGEKQYDLNLIVFDGRRIICNGVDYLSCMAVLQALSLLNF